MKYDRARVISLADTLTPRRLGLGLFAVLRSCHRAGDALGETAGLELGLAVAAGGGDDSGAGEPEASGEATGLGNGELTGVGAGVGVADGAGDGFEIISSRRFKICCRL